MESENTAFVITVSDGVSSGTREDQGGQLVAEYLLALSFIVHRTVVPDDRLQIERALRAAVEKQCALVVTTGGTGLGPRDVTPEATRSVMEREVPGLAEQMRRIGLEQTPFAILSRGVCGVSARTLILNVPGNPKGAVDSLKAVAPVLKHALAVLRRSRYDHALEKD
ncbi:MogA/MoaB family molybdenum cofactor biosynthesis protein [Ferroacidibacillus organovorans]|uniref:MoaB/Mog domain-containing protein n=1 Tax=Ferroacidibacillus organovorans TaxID=1765683 RepID=A0A117SY29_9BACL|nr:MogA/MoaB family molybdenum cofactor biosynthesis protein [Ferroacidibacillus organovorans]KUO96321.1 hypothetical protein ATW55_03690 [Ferroacidibacillus organovorans]